MDDVDRLVEISRVVEPNEVLYRRYDDLYYEYRQLYEVLVPIYRRLYQVQ
jgi:sugar (pentulose or hexulose) kinase